MNEEEKLKKINESVLGLEKDIENLNKAVDDLSLGQKTIINALNEIIKNG
jgi:hypothetical protein